MSCIKRRNKDLFNTDDDNDSFVFGDILDDPEMTPTKTSSKTSITRKKKNKKRKTIFQKRHELMYAVKHTFSQLNRSHVTHATCQLCVYFLREKKVNSKRQPTAQIKTWQGDFRLDNYTHHHKVCHPVKWVEYKNCKNKENFFDGMWPARSTITRYFGEVQKGEEYEIDASIIDVIIGKMLWHPEDSGSSMTWKTMMMAFEVNFDDETGENHYSITIKNTLQFELVIDYISFGASFVLISKMLATTKDKAECPRIGTASTRLVSTYARYAVALNLQSISTFLRQAATFSLATNGSTHMSTIYADVRVRLSPPKDGLKNLHVLAIPSHDYQSAEQMFIIVNKILSTLLSNWPDKIIAVSTDGEPKITGRLRGLVTRISDVAKPGMYRIWCGAHQLDLVLKSGYKGLYDESFINNLTKFISHLRRQVTLRKDMETTCPTLAKCRWESIDKCSSWFNTWLVELTDYLATKAKKKHHPPQIWWIYIIFISKFSKRATIAYKEM